MDEQKKSQGTPSPLPISDEKESLLTNTEDTFDVGKATNDGVGTIVTDKRRTRQSLLGVITGAASEWTGDKAETVKSLEIFQKPEVPKVAPGTERKEIIKKAVTTAKAEAQDDHKIVVERIKTFQSDAERVTGRPFIIRKEEADKKGGWSHMIGEEVAPEKTLPATSKNFPEVQHIHREDITSQSHNQPIAPTVTERTTIPMPAIPVVEEVLTPLPPKPAVAIPVVPSPVVPRVPTPVPQMKKRAETRAVQSEVVEEEVILPTSPLKIPRDKRAPEAERVSTPREGSGRGLIVALSIIVALTVGGLGFGGYYLFSNQEPVVAGVPVPVFLQADERVSLPLSNDRAGLLSSIETAVSSHLSGILHIYFVYPSSDTTIETLATTADFFGVLAPRVNSAFIRSLDERMMLGGVATEGVEPYLLLKSNAFDTAFAGMLEWETFMSADLAPLFGEPVSRSFDPNARSDDRTTRLAFTDRTIGNHNVRTLYDETGNERITYGFVNRNTIVIAGSEAAFLKLLAALQ